MYKYILKRLLYSIPIIVGITVITFAVMFFTPGKPTDAITDFNTKITSESKERLYQLYGLDKPVYEQYWNWFKRVIVFDFGQSFKDGQPASEKIIQRLPATILLNVLSMLLMLIVAVPAGVYSAVKKYTAGDRVLTSFMFICFSVPAFWVALMLMIVFGLWLGWLPISGIVSFNFDRLSLLGKVWDLSKHLILPVFVSSLASFAVLSRYVRSGMLDVLKQDYIKAAYAKGFSRKDIIFKHALKNALLPLITIIGLSIPALVGGSFIIETVFSYPGMGRLGFEAIMARDYPVIMGIGVISAFLTLAGNIVADVLYSVADPRIRYK
ncbi:ABC transporter permease [Endomicrobium proavitum]|uniref:Oligopeptide transport system permease protein AppB n=1 Tax=Endomicrobium proavitum TaxID=1408281 RepID=A0A0G3WGQ3_9BACT|nr:ABC transporter permease [Endomicrobium proavitum]AKL97498.1 Oligopeptide transport system permease protein AppB [Endomicrobium proavitum]